MAAQYGNVSAYGVHERPRIGPEDVARFRAESGAGYEVPSVEPSLRDFGSDRIAPPPRFDLATPRKRAPSGDPNTTSSSEARAFDAYGRFHLPEPRWLTDALAELAEVDDEIAEDDLPQVSDTTKAEAERLVRALAWTPLAPSVYPTQDAEIALHFKSPGVPGTVVILLSDGGRADCHAYVDGRSRRAHYQTSSDLPDAFVLDQLRRLTPDGTAFSGAAATVLPFPTEFQTNLLSTW